jgi:DTW domain-containing protein YfiP
MHRTLCICSLLPSLATRTRLVLVLHQLESRKTTNTGRLAARCLANSQVVFRGRDDEMRRTDGPGDGAGASLWPPDSDPVLLLPHETARPLTEWASSPRPVTLIVPDGTWRQVKKTRRRIPGLDRVPCAVLPGADSSRYRLRRDARPDRLATLEAIALAMGVLEGAEIQRALLHVFAVMVDRTLWTNGRIATEEVTGGIPAGVFPHDPTGAAATARDPLEPAGTETDEAAETRSACPDNRENSR